MDYKNIAENLRLAADSFIGLHPELPDVAMTYRKCAQVIEEMGEKYEASVLALVNSAQYCQYCIHRFEHPVECEFEQESCNACKSKCKCGICMEHDGATEFEFNSKWMERDN